ncbi:MAG: MBL fold metallo-hydrolase [Streptosporangiales bacterium]|nr:MBL fold metallo-hydrolase [Streptosporangiales bacterium]MBO0890384.1 MBL fold metallo-hydrolase [Acidothermales bacterium]
MRLTKLVHSCIRLERDGRTLVIDPGVFGADEDLAGADAVLVTHEHPDHVDVTRLQRALAADEDLHVWTNAAVARLLDQEFAARVDVIAGGDTFEAAGLDVRVHGEQHALVRDDLPIVANTGYLIEGVFHPGDAFTVPDQSVSRLLLPINAPWAKLNETLVQLRAVCPTHVHPIHDASLSEIGRQTYGAHAEQISAQVGCTFRWLMPGDTVDL